MLPFANFARDAYFEHAQRFPASGGGHMAPSNGTVGQTPAQKRAATRRRNQNRQTTGGGGVTNNPPGALPEISYERLCGIVEGFGLAHHITPAQTMAGLNKHRTW
jgi:hypothetical protein